MFFHVEKVWISVERLCYHALSLSLEIEVNESCKLFLTLSPLGRSYEIENNYSDFIRLHVANRENSMKNERNLAF